MTGEETLPETTAGDDVATAASRRDLPPAALRALAEAEERRRLADATRVERPKEILGRDGPEPVRYGDWERKGRVSDF